MSGSGNNHSKESSRPSAAAEFSVATEFRFATLTAMAACPLVLYGSYTERTWLMLLGLAMGPFAILAGVPRATRGIHRNPSK